MNKWIQIDERAERISGKVSFIFLGITQAELLVGIVYQRYLLGRSGVYYNDLAIVFGLSVVGFWINSLYLGGLL